MSKLRWKYFDYPNDQGFSVFLDVIANGSPAAVGTADEFSYVHGSLSVVFDGTFSVNGLGQVTGGKIAGFEVYDNGTLVLDASGYNLKVSDFKAALAAALDPTNPDEKPIFDAILSDRMIVTGSSMGDFLFGSGKADRLVGNGADDALPVRGETT